MKKAFLITLFAVLCPLMVFSQSMVIHLANGDSVVVNLEDVQNIMFSMNTSTPDSPVLNVSPHSHDFGTNSSAKQFRITNSGTGQLEWSVDNYPNWVSVSVTTGTTTTETDYLTVSVDRSALQDGNNTGVIQISSNGGDAAIAIEAEKEEENPTVDGRWRNDFDLSGTPFGAYTTLTQNGSSLTGRFEFDDGSGSQNIGSQSYINGKSIRIYFMVGSYSCYFSGTVSNDFQSMSGSLYALGVRMGSWEADRTGTGKVLNLPLNGDKPVAEALEDYIRELMK